MRLKHDICMIATSSCFAKHQHRHLAWQSLLHISVNCADLRAGENADDSSLQSAHQRTTCITSWHSILMCNKSTSAGTSLEVHRCVLTPCFIEPSILWRVSAPGGGKMRKQLLKDHTIFNNSPIFVIGMSAVNIFSFQKALHTIHFNLNNCFGFDERYLTP